MAECSRMRHWHRTRDHRRLHSASADQAVTSSPLVRMTSDHQQPPPSSSPVTHHFLRDVFVGYDDRHRPWQAFSTSKVHPMIPQILLQKTHQSMNWSINRSTEQIINLLHSQICTSWATCHTVETNCHKLSAWSPHYAKEDKELLENARQRFTRMFKELKGNDYNEIPRYLNWWTLEYSLNWELLNA